MSRAEAPLETEALERQLDRLQGFFPRIDSKASALLAITFAQIAAGALNLSADDFKKWWITAPAVFFGLSVAGVLINLYRCAYPHLDGGHGSLIYFTKIAELRESEYVERITTVKRAEFRSDLAGQIWRNAEILTCKYRYLKNATIALLLSVVPWTMLVIATSLTHWKVPGSG